MAGSAPCPSRCPPAIVAARFEPRAARLPFDSETDADEDDDDRDSGSLRRSGQRDDVDTPLAGRCLEPCRQAGP